MAASQSSFEIIVNGCAVTIDGLSTNMTLLQWLRATGRTGTKEGCAEGDCGACTVALVDLDAHGAHTYRAINSCITLLPMVAGREIVTVEGIAPDGVAGSLHPVQKAMVDRYGSQCGYCTPGFVVSMFEAYYRTDLAAASGDTRAKIGDQLNGNLCRCTGYRPIRDAMLDALKEKNEDDPFAVRLSKSAPIPTAPALAYEASNKTTFLRPASLDELLAIKAEHGANAELVAGGTEIGVYINKQHRRYPLLVSTEAVRELSAIEKDDAVWRVGGNATLTALEEALAGENPPEYPMIGKMLLAFASRQIRNRATLAGNIVTASPIADMPPLLLALDAEVVLMRMAHGGHGTRQERTVPIGEFFTGYRQCVLAPDEVVRWILLPRNAGRRMDSYKVSKRRELDISIVAAAFVVDTNNAGVVVHARLAFGGVAPTPARAKKTEAFLVGKDWNEITIADASAVLATEFTPIDDHRAGAEYRRDLILSLFEKFFRGEKSEAQDRVLMFDPTPASEPSRDACSALAHESAIGHVTGAALYVDDVARRRPMLELWPVCSPHARAKVVSIDTVEASKEPGIVAVLTAKDVPGTNDVGAIRHDEPLFAAEGSEACFHGHVVALVVGESYEACRLAGEKVKVIYEPLEPVLGIRDAMAKQSFHTDPHIIRRGDCDSALANSAHRFSGEIETGGQEHFYLESHAAWAERGEDGEIFVCSSTQHPSEIQNAVAHLLRLPRSKVIVQSPRMGGGFGGKETQGNTWAGFAAVAAFKTGRPVRIQLDRDLDMMLTGKRHPFYAHFEVGYDGSGHLNAARIALVSDGGWALDLSQSINDRAIFHLDNAYYVPACDFSGRVAKTNTVSHTAFRGFGGPQGMVVIEEILDRIARRLGLPPEQVRERNLYRGTGDSNTTHYGQPLGDERIPAIWSRLLTTSRFAERRAEIDRFNAAQGTRVKRGLAITPVKFGISFTATFLNQAGALVLIYRDGSVQVNQAGTEMGQGLYTKIQGVAMRELGLPASAIRVMRTQTDKVPNTSPTAASSASDLNGQAVRLACETLRERLAAVAAEMLSTEKVTASSSGVVFENGVVRTPLAPGVEITFAKVVERAYMKQVALSAAGFYSTPGIGYDRSKGRGRPFFYFAYGAAVAEVEVDGYSGMKRVIAVDILQDVGESLNPGVDRGQIEGAFVQGMGWLTGEELQWSKDGKLLTHSASTYQIPSIGDTPERMTVERLTQAAQPGTIYGSKAVGEPPLMLAISVREAIRDAIAAFGRPGGEVALASPATHEAIRAAIRVRLARVVPSSGRAAD